MLPGRSRRLIPQTQENVVQDCLRCVAIAEDAQEHSQQARRQAVIKLAQRVRVALSNASQQVLGGGHLSHFSLSVPQFVSQESYGRMNDG